MKELFLLIMLYVFQVDASSKVSVIVPVYNTEIYLSRCLESIINQSYKNIEIICINDGSLDSSLKILKNYAKKDSRIIVIDQKNTGVAGARNAGLNRATGEIITFVDSDDYIHPEMIEISLSTLIKYDSDIIMFMALNSSPISEKTNFKKIDMKNLKLTEQSVSDLNFSIKDKMRCIFCWNKIYKRSVINNTRFNTTVCLSEDFLFNFFVFNNAKKCVFLDEKLYYYTGDNQSLSRSVFTKAKVEYNKVILEETSKYSNFIPAKKRDEFFSDIVYCLLCYAFLTSFSLDVFLSACDVVCDFYFKNSYKVHQQSMIQELFIKCCLGLGKVRKMLDFSNKKIYI